MPAPKGHPRYGGRTKGTKNRRTKVAEEFAQSFLADPEYQESVRQRIIKGEQWLEELVFHYAYGKPVERSITENTQHVHNHGENLKAALEMAEGLRNGHHTTTDA